MKHSNRKQLEDEYAKELDRIREEKRDRILPQHEIPKEKKRRKKRFSLPCCFATALIIVGCIYLIGYLLTQIGEPLVDEIEQKTIEAEQLAEKAKQLKKESEKKINQGKELYEKIQGAKQQYKELQENINNVVLYINNVQEKIQDKVKIDNSVMPNWLALMNEDPLVPKYRVPKYRCDLQDNPVYIALGSDPDCFDCYANFIYNAKGEFRCATDGGISGNGDGNCPGVFANLNNCFIWNSEKWEKTEI